MPARATVYLTDANVLFLKTARKKFRSVSDIVQTALDKLQQDSLKGSLKEYYQQKSEDYRALHEAQAKVIKKLESE